MRILEFVSGTDAAAWMLKECARRQVVATTKSMVEIKAEKWLKARPQGLSNMIS